MISRNRMVNILIGIAFFLIVLSFFSPWIFTRASILGIVFDQKSGQVGDTIGGIMNPFIGMAGVILTFLAFYIQFRANNHQLNLIRSEKRETEKRQIEQRFFNMIDFHHQNVKDIRLVLTKYSTKSNYSGQDTQHIINHVQVDGRQVFFYYLLELKAAYFILLKYDLDKDSAFEKAYQIFFHGYKNVGLNDDLVVDLNSASFLHKSEEYRYFRFLERDDENYDSMFLELNYPILEGHSHQLSYYYRHLFQTVKYIVNQPERILSYEEKRYYLRLLRAQLTNEEQALLFYNWKSGFGKAWENDSNKFFTDYRMIHNIYNDLLFNGIDLMQIPEFQRDFKTENGRKRDSLFEFQDWNEQGQHS